MKTFSCRATSTEKKHACMRQKTDGSVCTVRSDRSDGGASLRQSDRPSAHPGSAADPPRLIACPLLLQIAHGISRQVPDGARDRAADDARVVRRGGGGIAVRRRNPADHKAAADRRADRRVVARDRTRSVAGRRDAGWTGALLLRLQQHSGRLCDSARSGWTYRRAGHARQFRRHCVARGSGNHQGHPGARQRSTPLTRRTAARALGAERQRPASPRR